MDETVISIRGVGKSFGPVQALADIDLGIRRGEFFSLLGPSGCGKTTLLRMIAGFAWPTSGEIFIDGEPMSSVPPNRRPVRLVFQNYAIFPHLNVRENILYGLRRARLGAAERQQVVREALAMIKLEGYEERRSDQLSGGERQRVALARALVCRPKVLLLDEPLGALDKKLREAMQIELQQLQRQVGITFVFVTHDQEEALAMSDRVAVMSRGRVLQVDDPVTLYEAPRSRTVAGFIGTMNFFPARVERSSEGRVEVAAGPLGALRTRPRADAPPVAGAVLAAIRPEKIGLHWSAPSDRGNTVEGRLGPRSYFGDRSHYLVEVPGLPEPIAVSQTNADRPQEAQLQGRPVWLSFPEQSLLLLPEQPQA